MGFWFYDCVEFRDLVEWMKYQNIYKNKKLYVYGFDIFYPELCVEFIVSNIKTKSKKNADLIQNNYNLFLCFKKNNYIDYYKTSKNFKRKCKNLLIENFNLLKTKYCKLQNITEILQNAQIILQAEHYFSILNFTKDSYAVRDKYMSDNIIWLHKRMLHSKIFVWTHNGHASIKKYSNGFTNMGYNIKKYFKNSLHIGMTFYKGFFYAIHSDDILPSVNFTPPPNINYIEHYLNKINKTSFIFDLKKSSKQKRFKFLNKVYNFRSIGVIFNLLYFEKYYCKANIYKDFNAIIYFKNITPISLNEKIINIQNIN